MANFHINPETGEPGKCSAAEGNCPFKDVSEHFESAAEARESYEKEMESEEKYEELKGLSKDLINTTLKLRAELDERMKHKAADPEWGAIKDRVAAAKAAHQKVLDKVSSAGLTPKDLILGVDNNGNIFNKAQLWRVRPYVAEEYTRMAGVPLRVGSKLPMPGDATIAKDRANWEKDRAALEVLPAGSPEREAARVALVKRIARDVPTKYGLDALQRTKLSDAEQMQVLRGQAVHKAIDKQRSAGIQNGKEAGVFVNRYIKSAQDFIDSFN